MEPATEAKGSTMEIETLLKQIGAAVLMELGAREFVSSETTTGGGALHFRVRRNQKIRISLDPSDTYSVELWHCNGANIFQIGETVEGVYADSIGRVCLSVVAAAATVRR